MKSRGSKSPEIDEDLWQECQDVIPSKKPTELPHLCGEIDGLKILIVDGNQVMVNHDMDFNTAGNHEEDHGLCAADEVVLDSRIDLADIAFDLMHELVERPLIKKYRGQGMSLDDAYAKAHKHANAVEKTLRLRELGKHPERAGKATKPVSEAQ
jgi:hypothetical protein